MSDKTSCTCTHCANACETKPGWFMPEQIPALLDYFQVKTVRELLPKLGIDYFDGPEDGPLVLSPNIVGNDSHIFPVEPRGVCVFLKDRRCTIHAVKPFECAQMLHSDSHEAVGVRHAEIAMAWRGRPELEEFRKDIPGITFGDILGLLTKSIERFRPQFDAPKEDA